MNNEQQASQWGAFRFLVFIHGNEVVKILNANWSYVPLFLCEADAITFGEENYPGIYSVVPQWIEGNILESYDRSMLQP